MTVAVKKKIYLTAISTTDGIGVLKLAAELGENKLLVATWLSQLKKEGYLFKNGRSYKIAPKGQRKLDYYKYLESKGKEV